MALATVTVTCLLLALVAALALHDPAPRDDGASAGPAGTLAGQMAVLRRPQQATDAPATVVVTARKAAARAAAPYAGTIEAADVRRLAATGGHRLYLAPLQGGAAGLVILTDARDRSVQRPYGLTPQLLRSGAFYLSYGLRGTGTTPDDRRSLQAQVVPDGVSWVEYRYPVGRTMLAAPASGFGVVVRRNAAITVLQRDIANASPAMIVAHDGRTVVQRVVPSTRGAGAVAPETICRGVSLPAQPARGPSRTGRMTLQRLCEQMGLPLRAHRAGPGELLLLYPGETLFAAHDGVVGLMTHLTPGDPFPPPVARGVPSTAEKLPSR
jgi:hypothetical protein